MPAYNGAVPILAEGGCAADVERQVFAGLDAAMSARALVDPGNLLLGHLAFDAARPRDDDAAQDYGAAADDRAGGGGGRPLVSVVG